MLEDGLGPVFKSSFTGHTRSEYGKNFTFIYAKKMCYADAQLINYLVNRQTYRDWLRDVWNFCEGNNDLYNCLVGIVACYADFLAGRVGKRYASELMKEETEQLKRVLLGQTGKKAFLPFAKNPACNVHYDLRQLVVNADETAKEKGMNTNLPA